MSNILSNIAALKSLYHLNRNQEGYATSMERISSGKRINAAGDDAAMMIKDINSNFDVLNSLIFLYFAYY